MYTLYHNPYSQHARRVVSLLEEAGLGYELRNVSLIDGEQYSHDYIAINPNHQVPTLIDGGIKLHESNAILRYLCIKHELSDWYPQESAIRAMVEQWLDWNQSRLAPPVIDIVFNRVFLGTNGDASAIARGEEKVAELASILDAGLARADFIAGDKPTIADLSLASNVFQLELAEAVPALPNIKAWYHRMQALEGFQRSLPQS